MPLAAIDTQAVWEDVRDYVQDHPEVVAAGLAGFVSSCC